MTTYSSANVAFLLIDGFSVLGVTTEISAESPLKREEVTPLGASAEVYASAGITSTKMSQKGYFDDATGSSHEALAGRNGTSRIICFGVEGNTIRKNFIGLSGAIQTQYDPGIKVGELHKSSAEYIGSAAKEDGKILHAHGAKTAATGNTQASSVNNGASSASGGSGFFELSALTLGGYTNFQAVLQDSADNITFADITGGAFTAKTTSPAAQRLTLSGTIRQYTACRWAFSGAGSGNTATFMAGIVRN